MIIARVKKSIQNLTFNKIFISLFLIVYCGLYYQEYVALIACSYALLGGAFIYNLIKHRGLIYKDFIVLCLIFVIYSFFSSLWAESFDTSYNSVIQLSKSAVVAICFITLIDSKEHFKWALFILSLSGIIYALLYLNHVDISSLGANRIMAEGDFLPNVNTVGLIISFSFAYFIYMYFLDKKYVYMALAGLAFIVTFFLGSRKSIISLFICVFLMFSKLQKTSKLKILFLLVILIALLLFYVPIEYLNFISERLAQLSFWSSKMSEIDSSDETRVRLIEYGLTYCIESPILGHGYYSFSQLFRKDCGIILYSHNNFIETFVGGGIIGFFIYYSLHGIILKRIDLRKAHFDYGYLLFVLLMILLFNHFSIVVLQDRFVWLLLTVLFTGSIYYKYNLL